MPKETPVKKAGADEPAAVPPLKEPQAVARLTPEQLEAKVEQQAEQIKMLLAVADKGRVFSYEAGKAEKVPSKVKLSVWNGQIITGWRTVKDTLIKHPTTGRTVGEEQEYEVILLDKDGTTGKATILGYPAFSDARYNERIEADIVSHKEAWNGTTTLQLALPDGRSLELDARYAN